MTDKPEWLNDAALMALFAAVRAAGGDARVVGGAVRDHLMRRESGDIDIATTLLPDAVMALAAAQGWKAIPTGIAHGTVSLMIAGRVIEVTTLRRDVETDGRHAIVAFTTDWQVDASRRDFTMNAMSMDAEGALYDYFDGQADCAAQRVRFIGDAATRITEDGLRMLRYFRFLASHGKPPADADALAAITANRDKIAALSGERIATEMRKLLSAEAPAFALRLMAEAGVDAEIFPRATLPARLIRLQMLEAQAQYQTSVWARVWLLIAATTQDAGWLTDRWKLARHETAQLKLLASLPAFAADAPRHFHTRLLRLHGAPAYLDWLLLQAVLQPGTDIAAHIALAQDFVPPAFPVTAADLMAMGMKQGKALGERLAALEATWEESDYMLGKEDLLNSIS